MRKRLIEHDTLLENLKGMLRLFQACSETLGQLQTMETKAPDLYDMCLNCFYEKMAGDTFFTAWVIQNSAMEFFRAETSIYAVPEGPIDDHNYVRRCGALKGLYDVLINITAKTIAAIEGELVKESA